MRHHLWRSSSLAHIVSGSVIYTDNALFYRLYHMGSSRTAARRTRLPKGPIEMGTLAKKDLRRLHQGL